MWHPIFNTVCTQWPEFTYFRQLPVRQHRIMHYFAHQSLKLVYTLEKSTDCLSGMSVVLSAAPQISLASITLSWLTILCLKSTCDNFQLPTHWQNTLHVSILVLSGFTITTISHLIQDYSCEHFLQYTTPYHGNHYSLHYHVPITMYPVPWQPLY